MFRLNGTTKNMTKKKSRSVKKAKKQKLFYLVTPTKGQPFVQDCYSYERKNGVHIFHQTDTGNDKGVTFPDSQVLEVVVSREGYSKLYLR
jgi:hypothetical protein